MINEDKESIDRSKLKEKGSSNSLFLSFVYLFYLFVGLIYFYFLTFFPRKAALLDFLSNFNIIQSVLILLDVTPTTTIFAALSSGKRKSNILSDFALLDCQTVFFFWKGEWSGLLNCWRLTKTKRGNNHTDTCFGEQRPRKRSNSTLQKKTTHKRERASRTKIKKL